MKITADYHIHTCYSGHSAPDQTPERIRAHAATAGLTHIGILEHVNSREESARLYRIREEVEALPPGGPEILLGVELNPDTRTLLTAIDRSDVADIGLDYVLLGLHWRLTREICAVDSLRFRCELELLAASLPWVDILAHPFWEYAPEVRLLGAEPWRDLASLDPGWVREFARTCRRAGTAVEMNGAMFTGRPPEFLRGYKAFFAALAGEGVLLSIGSDAHHPTEFARHQTLQQVVDELGLTDHCFLHLQPKKRPAQTIWPLPI